MKRNKWMKVMLLVLFLTTLAGCNTITEQNETEQTKVNQTGALTEFSTVTPVPEVTAQPTVTPLPEVMDQPTVTPLPTEIPMPTATGLPDMTIVPTVTPLPQETVTLPESSTFSVTFLDVGQGDAAIVECDGHYMLIDGGDTEYSSQMYSYMKRNAIDMLDIVVATHAHADHAGGLSGALNYATAGLVLCPVTEYDTDTFRNFAKFAEKNGSGITVPEKFSTYALGSAVVTILGLNAGSSGNDASIILSITYADKVFLFTGDAEREAEQAVLAECPELLKADVLKVGHHGSASSTTYPFLREVLPEIAVISCGVGNSYGHPTDSALSRLRDADVTVYRTDLQGDIVISYDGEQWNVATQKEATQDVFTSGDELLLSGGSKEVDTERVTTTTEETVDDAARADYVANKNTKKFHYPGCSSVKRMKESNKLSFENVTREEMIKKGYEPCETCNP